MVTNFCVSLIVPEDLMFVLILMIERRGVCTSDKLFVCPEFSETRVEWETVQGKS